MKNKKISNGSLPTLPADRIYTLRNAHGMSVTLSERGAAMQSWWAPDRYGHLADVLLGYPGPEGYLDNPARFGAVIGRWASLIRDGRFTLDGVAMQAETNDGAHHRHGGVEGFHCARWRAAEENDGVSFRLASPDGEAGFPGNLEVQIHYRLDDDGALTLEYEAVADAATPLNLSAYPCFNLNGGSADVGDHMLRIDADYYLEVDAGGLPGARAPVGGTAFDFRQPAPIGTRLLWPDPQIQLAQGFDHFYCMRPQGKVRAGALREVARVVDPGSGRQLQVSTTEPGLQFYSGNALEGVAGRGARPYAKRDGFCLSAHAYPDQLNGLQGEAVILRPGEVYRQTTIYKLGLQQ